MERETGGGVRASALEKTQVWNEAWSRALPLVDGAVHGRLPGARDGVELAYLDWGGERPLAVLLHANGFCAATWAPIAAALRDCYRVIAVDARGHGDSTAVVPGSDPDAYTWETLARDIDCALAALLAEIGCERIALGVGHSMGGALVTHNAVLRPERFEKLLLCDPVLLPPPGWAPGSNALSAPLSAAPTTGPSAGRGANPLAEASRRRRDRFPSAAEAYAHCRSRALYASFTPEALALYVGLGMRETATGELVLKCDREVEAAIFDSGGSLDLMPRIGELKAELLILHAGRSGFSRPYYEELASRTPRARVDGVDAGHLFPMEEPGLVIGWIEHLGAEPRGGSRSNP